MKYDHCDGFFLFYLDKLGSLLVADGVDVPRDYSRAALRQLLTKVAPEPAAASSHQNNVILVFDIDCELFFLIFNWFWLRKKSFSSWYGKRQWDMFRKDCR